MISYTLKHLHQDIKQHLFCGRVLTNWNPHYFCALKEYIAADMAKLNNLCNHGNSRSFAVCFNDFMLTDARGRRKFDQQRFLQLCRTKFGSEADGLLKSMQLTDPAQKFRSFRKGKSGYCFISPDFKQTIIIYCVSGFNPADSMSTPYHEYSHALDFKYSLLEQTEAYRNYRRHSKNSRNNTEQKELADSYFQEWHMLQESFADCFAYGCLALKEPDNPAIYRWALYNMAVKFRNVVENKHSPLYCGYAATRTVLNRIRLDCRCRNLKKYYLNDGSIDFLSFAETCAEAVKEQGYNHDNYLTLTTYPLLSTPPATNLSPRQFDQWHYDYLDAQITARQNRVANPFYRLLYGIGQEMLQTADNNKILSLLDKYEIPAFKNCFNEYRFIIKQQSSYRPHNLAQLRQQQKSRT